MLPCGHSLWGIFSCFVVRCLIVVPNPFMSNGLIYLISLDWSISSIYVVSGYILSLPCFIEIPLFSANGVDPDQTPRSAASDLGLHCLPMSLLWDARHK